MKDFFKEEREALIKESKECLPVLKEIALKSDSYYKQKDFISKPVLMKLLDKAIDKIDELKNGGEYDERDAMDQLCDREFIFEDLVKASIEDCELFVEG